MIRLLAGANIGGSGYQIISQGEADRILNASPRERREMVEDALGLKLYQHKKAEAQKKLEETGTNIEKTKSLRRELGPHLNFLRIQVEKIEKARELREELSAKVNDYLARENAWITQEDARLLDEARAYDEEAKKLSHRVAQARQQKSESQSDSGHEYQTKLREHEEALSSARHESARISRELGRAEGALEAVSVSVDHAISTPQVRDFAHDIEGTLAHLQTYEDIHALRDALAGVRHKIKTFIEGLSTAAVPVNEDARHQLNTFAAALEQSQQIENSITKEIAELREALARSREAGYAAERDMVGLEAQLREVQGRLSRTHADRTNIALLKQRFEEEVREGITLVGAAIHQWQNADIPEGALSEDRSVQEKRRRDMERLKIKIEEAGIGNGEAVLREFTQTKERDEFLARELMDLEKSAASLQDIIADLERTIDIRFTEGLKHINEALRNFFTKLFNGGEAKLFVDMPTRRASSTEVGDEDEMGDSADTEEESLYAGLSISVSLPRKKVRGLEVLSGGERALTSIALIFSMSQVNPPPFLILDETDAALDEANSKRYADMIRELGAHSQLIVITHNRATMAAAGELYGVTMGSDGVSKLLSVKLEEAAKVAK